MLALPCWPSGFDGGLESLAALKNLTSELIGRVCRSAQDATLAAELPASGPPASRRGADRGRLTSNAADLVVPRPHRPASAPPKGVTPPAAVDPARARA